jgi:hypothetical protein
MSMKYLSLDTIDLTEYPYPQDLYSLAITIRGTKNLFDIYFSAIDVESGFGISLSPQIDFTWINTSSGKEKYLSYPTMKRILYPIQENHPLVAAYLTWVDSLLFSAGKSKPFYRCSYASLPSSIAETIDGPDDLSDLDDSSSVYSLESVNEDKYLTSALHHKIDHVAAQGQGHHDSPN